MTDTTRGELAYRLDSRAVRQRAIAGLAVSIVRSLAPIAIAVVLLRRLGWATPAPFWIVTAMLAALVVVRAAVGFGAERQGLASLEITLSDEAIRVRTWRDAYSIERGQVSRVTEIAGPLGGIVVESKPHERSGVGLVAKVPRGGEGFQAMRLRLERWRAFERRGRRGPAARLAVSGLVVGRLLFVPFLLADFVAHSRLLGTVLIAGLLLLLRRAS